MQPHDSSRFRSPDPRRNAPTPPFAAVDGTTPPHAGLAPEMPFAESRVVVAAPALLIEARFRGVPLASRLLRADEPRAFTIGGASGVDAPVNPAYIGRTLGAAGVGAAGHKLIEPLPGGFAVNLAPAMRAELLTPVQALPLRPDFGSAEAPLALPADSFLRVACGEVSFDLFAAEPAAEIERPRFAARFREHARYDIGVALACLALLLIVRAIPEDPRSLSLSDDERLHRMSPTLTIPLTVESPPVDKAIAASKLPGGGGAKAAKGPQGQAGDKHAKPGEGRRQVQGNQPQDARDVAGEIRKNSILQFLDGPKSGALGQVMDDKPALGEDAQTALAHLQGPMTASVYGTGLAAVGTGDKGGGTGDHTLGTGVIATVGRFGPGDGAGEGPGRGDYGRGVGKVSDLGKKKNHVPDPILGVASVSGTLDKEIIRRIVRRHLNEVKYCYDQALARQPKLDGRLVAQFTIAANGQVIASLRQSSTLGSPAVEMCVVNAIKRWEFPAPTGGGLAIVTYPFTFSPAGN
jgi:TonB family protein